MAQTATSSPPSRPTLSKIMTSQAMINLKSRRRSSAKVPPATQALADQIAKLRFPNHDPVDDLERATKWLAKLETYQKRRIPLRFDQMVNEMVHQTAIITTEIAVKSPSCEKQGEFPSKSRGASVDWPDEWDYDYTEEWLRVCLSKSR